MYFEENTSGNSHIWMKVVVQNTFYKNTEAYLMQLINDDAMSEHEIFQKNMSQVTNNIHNIIQELTVPIDSVVDLEKYYDEYINKKNPSSILGAFNPLSALGSNFRSTNPNFASLLGSPGSKPSTAISGQTPVFGGTEPVSNKLCKRKLNAKNAAHQILAIINNNALNHSNQLILNEYNNPIPKAYFTLAYYFYSGSKVIYYSALSIEHLERNACRNTCTDKLLEKYGKSEIVETDNEDLRILKRSCSFKAIELPNSYTSYAKNDQNIINPNLLNIALPIGNNNDTSINLKSPINSSNSIRKSPSFKAIDFPKNNAFKNINDLLNISQSQVSNNSLSLPKLQESHFRFECISTNSKSCFEEQVQLLYYISTQKKINLNLHMAVNEEIYINKGIADVVFFNILYFIIQNGARQPIKKGTSSKNLNNIVKQPFKEKLINIKITKELTRNTSNSFNLFAVTIKFKEGSSKIPYSDLKQLIEIIDREMEEKGEDDTIVFKSEYLVSFIDKFNLIDIGLISSLYLLSINKIGDKKLTIQCGDAKNTTNFTPNHQGNEEIVIKFTLPYIPNHQHRESISNIKPSLEEFYYKKVLTKIFKIDIPKQPEKEVKEENYEFNRKEVYDEGGDEYKGEEENITPAEDKKITFEPLKKILNESYDNIHYLRSKSLSIDFSIKKEQYDSLLTKINLLSSKIKVLTKPNDALKLNNINDKEQHKHNNAIGSNDSIMKIGAGQSLRDLKAFTSKQDNNNYVDTLGSFRSFEQKESKRQLTGIATIPEEESDCLTIKHISFNNINSLNNIDHLKTFNQSNFSLCNVNEKLHKVKWDIKDLKVKYFNPPRYLIVEDNYVGRSGLGKMIKSYNSKHFIDLVDNGPEAVEKFWKMISQGYIYDFVFMDIEIPDINGIDVAEYIREKEKIFHVHTCIAAVTGKNINEIPKNLFDYICKYK